MASAHTAADTQPAAESQARRPVSDPSNGGGSQGSPRPEPSAQQAVHVQRPLRRYPDRGLLGGVCAGLARHFGVPVLVVRLLTAMLIAVGGIGVAILAKRCWPTSTSRSRRTLDESG
jgi:phage shock protein PspC (stress-responsive transcriptional regulator)